MPRDATPATRLDTGGPPLPPTLARAARAPSPRAVARRGDTAVVTVLAPHERGRVDAAGDGCYTALHRESLDEVFDDLRQCRAAAVLLSVTRCDPRSTAHVARMVREFPGVPAVALLSDDTPRAAQAVLALGQQGVRALVDVRDATGWHALRHLINRQQGAHIVRRAIERIERELPDAPEDARRFLDGCFLSPARVGTVRALARRLGVGASTLMSRFYRAGLPAPKRYLAYARLVKAAALFENPGLTLSQVAHALEYSSPQSFSRHIHIMLDLPAIRFRQAYDGARMLDRFVQDLVAPWREALARFSPLVVQPAWRRAGVVQASSRATSSAAVARLRTGSPAASSASRPPSSRSTTASTPSTSPPSARIASTAVSADPPVVITSSTTTTRSPA
jgi:AraC-like DNA-binding protein